MSLPHSNSSDKAIASFGDSCACHRACLEHLYWLWGVQPLTLLFRPQPRQQQQQKQDCQQASFMLSVARTAALGLYRSQGCSCACKTERMLVLHCVSNVMQALNICIALLDRRHMTDRSVWAQQQQQQQHPDGQQSMSPSTSAELTAALELDRKLEEEAVQGIAQHTERLLSLLAVNHSDDQDTQVRLTNASCLTWL